MIPAFNEADAIAAVVKAIDAREPGGRSSSWTMDRPTPRRRWRAAAGAIVVKHPYNKGNGAAVKSGIRRATGEYI